MEKHLYNALQKTYPDIKYIDLLNENLELRWKGQVFLELPYANYHNYLKKCQIASSNFCLTFVYTPWLINHQEIYNFIFFQSQCIIFIPNNSRVLCVSGFYKKLTNEQIKNFYDIGKVYFNYTYKKNTRPLDIK